MSGGKVLFCYEGDEEIEPVKRCFYAKPKISDVAKKYVEYLGPEGEAELLGFSKDYLTLCYEKSWELEEMYHGAYVEVWKGKLVSPSGIAFGVCGVFDEDDNFYYAMGPSNNE